MAIKKQFLKSKPVCKVTFEVAADEAKTVSVVGDFNEWNAKAAPLKKLKNGKFKGILPFDTEQSYEFKYVIDGAYINEEESDSFVFNEFANAENGVLEL